MWQLSSWRSHHNGVHLPRHKTDHRQKRVRWQGRHASGFNLVFLVNNSITVKYCGTKMRSMQEHWRILPFVPQETLQEACPPILSIRRGQGKSDKKCGWWRRWRWKHAGRVRDWWDRWMGFRLQIIRLFDNQAPCSTVLGSLLAHAWTLWLFRRAFWDKRGYDALNHSRWISQWPICL